MPAVTRFFALLVSLSAFALSVLDILEKHLGVDARALLTSAGGDFGRRLAVMSAGFGAAVTWIAGKARDIVDPAPSRTFHGGIPGQDSCAPDGASGDCVLGAAETAARLSSNLQPFELGAQIVIVILAAILFLAATRPR
jgi:hypothetical protein